MQPYGLTQAGATSPLRRVSRAEAERDVLSRPRLIEYEAIRIETPEGTRVTTREQFRRTCADVVESEMY